MAFDGIVIANVAADLRRALIGGRIYKIYQPEADELLLIIKNQKETYRLLISAGASLPLIYLTRGGKANPMTAPNFCMLLRKHIANGRITEIRQPGMERIVIFTVEHLNELGDVCSKQLIVEIMGKHSNIIFVDEDGTIIDSIKHISAMVSSVREVLPGRSYQAPPSQNKIALNDLDRSLFDETVLKKPESIQKAVYKSILGISPVFASELACRAGLDADASVSSLNEDQKQALFLSLTGLREDIKEERFRPNIIYERKVPREFSSFPMTMFSDLEKKDYDSISQVLESFYAQKETVTRIRQKSSDLRRIVGNALERTARKYDLQLRQLEDTRRRDRYKVYGELLHTYGYSAGPGDKELVCTNYYDGNEIRIPLDPTLDAMENAARYFDRYGKLKRTFQALSGLTVETRQELDHLESISNALEIARDEEDLSMIREELAEYGYMRKHGSGRGRQAKKSRPLHYISSDGFHMYVGKNNYQNEELTFRLANGKDMWFHAKQMAGSHVIVKLETADDLPDSTYEEAAKLAAYYSKGRHAPKVEIDYTRRRNLKKPPGAKPGFVIYHTNYSMSIEPVIDGIREVD